MNERHDIDATRFAISPDDMLYRDAIARELYFWSHKRVMSDRERVSYPASHPLVVEYLNELIAKDPARDWLDYLVSEFNPKGRAASLGSGIGFYERRLLETCSIEAIDLYELCPANLNRAKTRLQIPGKAVDYHDVDLNFAVLTPESYDLIISRFFLHHIVNLEYLLDQINRALKPDGIFVLYDYIGESRYRWPQAKKDFINSLLGELKPLGVTGLPLGTHPGDDLYAPDDPQYFSRMIENSPFETIRSHDIPECLERRFEASRLVEVRYGAVLHAAFRTLDYSNWEHPGLRAALKVFIDLDRVTTEHDMFSPCGLFGVYGKAPDRNIECIPWSEEKIRAELVP